MIERMKLWLLKPLGKTIVFTLSVIVSGIACGTFVTEITEHGNLIWVKFYKTGSFYFLVVYVVLLYLYNRYIYIQESNITNFLDRDYCKAYIRSRSLPAFLSKYEDMIRKGESSSELVEIQNHIEELIR